MAKDAKGHGSEKRIDMVYSSNAGVNGHGKGMYARLASGAQYKLNPAATEGRIPRVGTDLDPSQHTDVSAAKELAQGNPKAAPAPVHGGATGRHDYNPESVNQAIASSNRAGRRIGGREAKLIHRLMKGR